MNSLNDKALHPKGNALYVVACVIASHKLALIDSDRLTWKL